MDTNRLIWIDWMKVIGMYFIIAGHISPIGHEYIYVFSVPLFFVVSGFLCKYEPSDKVFWNKLFRNLVLPCILISFICMCYDASAQYRLGLFQWTYIPKRIFSCLTGMQGRNLDEGGLGLCWFIYSLVICKILFQYTFKRKQALFFSLLCCLIVAYLVNKDYPNLYNAVPNTCLAFPFFVGGGVFRVFYERIDFSLSRKYYFLLMVFGILMVVLVQELNGTPWMFKAVYGNDLLLFFTGGLAGTIVVYVISRMLESYNLKYVQTLSNGLILILGFQLIALKFYFVLPENYTNVLTDYFAAFIILLAFIPVIKFAESYFPIILGYRAKKEIKER